MEKTMERVLFSPPDITEEEVSAVGDALRSGWITTGPRTAKFEQEIAAYCGTPAAVCMNCATSGLQVALYALGIGPGDEVIVPGYTYTSSASCIYRLGAKIVFCDIKPGTFEIDPDSAAKKITSKTKAIMPVDVGGRPCDYPSLFKLVGSKRSLFKPSDNPLQKALGRIAIVADAAHSIGATQDGVRTGSLADISVFSFHAVKNLTTGEGGAVTWRHLEGVDDNALAQKLKIYIGCGQTKSSLDKTNNPGQWEYDVVTMSPSFHMTDYAAAMGSVQLKRYPSLLKRRAEIIKRYDAGLLPLGIQRLVHFDDHNVSSGHLYLTYIPGVTREQRDEIIRKMEQNGISVNVHYKPLQMMTAYKELGYSIDDYPVTFDVFCHEMSLPLFSKMTNEQVDRVIEVYRDVVGPFLIQ
jgi:dTDP-4-amino-4,6-dideoxygalactose transaminase